MKERDMFDEIIEVGKKRGIITYDEINEALPAEFFAPDEVEDLIDLLGDMGVSVIDSNETISLEEIKPQKYEKTEDLIQAYFYSMGDISVLSKDEEVELAKKLDEGRGIIAEIVWTIPLAKRIEKDCANDEDILEMEEDEIRAHIIELALRRLEMYVESIEGLKSNNGNGKQEFVQITLKKIERDVGIKIETLLVLWERISRVQAFVLEAKNELITRNLRLVVNIAKNYVGRGLPLLDLIQDGNIGLMKAVDKFKHEKGFKFSTYATWWIRQAITRALIDTTKTIRVPVHMMEFYNKVTKASRELTQALGREPTNDEIAKKLTAPTRKVEEVFRVMENTVHLQTPMGDKNKPEKDELQDFIEDKSGPSPHADTENKEISGYIQKVLKTLTPKEEKVIRMRFGVGADRDHTLEEVGRHMTLTRERVRQIEAKALGKLKHPSRLMALKRLVSD